MCSETEVSNFSFKIHFEQNITKKNLLWQCIPTLSQDGHLAPRSRLNSFVVLLAIKLIFFHSSPSTSVDQWAQYWKRHLQVQIAVIIKWARRWIQFLLGVGKGRVLVVDDIKRSGNTEVIRKRSLPLFELSQSCWENGYFFFKVRMLHYRDHICSMNTLKTSCTC
jgi:hypothetical protein